MRLRKLALAVGLASALGADLASALGLGELKLNSALNQPLDAEIELLNIKDLSKDEILVNLAALEEFQRAGVDRLYFLTGLKFTIDLGSPSGPVVRVTTRNPVNEPYLNFLLKAEWPSGNLMREYTLLMDLPTFSNDSVRPIQRTETKAPRSNTVRPSTADSANSQPMPVSREDSASMQQGGSEYGPVSSTDTMWGIALKVRPDRSLSVQQTMLAIQRANPDAFINDNINLLRKGQVLRIPSHNEILDMTARQAISQVAEQNTAWTGKTAGRESAAPLDAANRSSTVRSIPTEVEGRVKLGVDTDSGDSGYGAGSDDSRSEALDNERAISLEELDKSNRQNGELKSRVSDLEAQIETMERMMEIANNDLRAMQLAGQSSEEASGQLLDATETAEAVVTVTDQVAEPKVVAEPKRSNKVVRPALPKDKSLVDLAWDNILYIGGGFLVLVGGVWMFLRRRKESEGFEEFDEPEELADVAISAEPDVADELDALELDDLSAAVSDDLDPSRDNDSLDVQPSENIAEAETGDVVGEVDIYIAYGKLDQAEQMLLKSLEDDANQIPVLLKLLEVYSESKNVEGFDQYCSRLEELGDDVAISRAAELRSGLSGASAYVAAAPMTESLSDDLDALLLEGDTPSIVEPEAEGQSLIVDGFELGAAVELDAGETAVVDTAEDLLPLDSEIDLPNLDSDEIEISEADDLDLDLDLDPALSDEGSAPTADEFELELDLDLGLADDADLSTDFTSDSSSNMDADVGLDSAPLDDLDLSLDISDELNAAGLDESFDMSYQDDLANTSAADLDLSNYSVVQPNEVTAVPIAENAGSSELAEEVQSELLGETQQDPIADIDITFGEDLSIEEDIDSDLEDLDVAALDQEMDDLDLDLDLEIPASVNEAVVAEAIVSELGGDTLQSGVEDELFAEFVPDAGVIDSDLSEFTAEGLDAAASDSNDMDDELDFLADTDEVSTKLDLARAYIDMGDSEGAKDILGEVQLEGDDTQKSEAEELLGRID